MLFYNTTQIIRKNHKNTNRNQDRNHNCQIHDQFFLLLLLSCLIFCKNFFFLVFKKTCRISQCLHSQHKRIHKIKNPPNERNLLRCLPWENSFVFLNINFNLSIWFPDGNGICFPILHHNAFQHCLAAYIR